MKILLSILVILSVLFLVSCSKVDTGNISKKELENLANKYGGIYIFNKKYYDEIEKREKERDKYMDDFFLSKKIFTRDDLKELDKQLPKILSNNKKYYTYWIGYENETNQKAKIPKIYVEKIKDFIGLDNYNKFKPGLLLSKFYIDSNYNITPISISAYYNVVVTKYGLFGDEGAGFHFSQKDIVDIGGDNIYYLEK